MSASKYLPPFTAGAHDTSDGDRLTRASAEPNGTLIASEVTYADFLGDEVDEVDEVGEVGEPGRSNGVDE